jgi:hypothetical protein
MKGDFSLNNMRASARVVFYCLQKKRKDQKGKVPKGCVEGLAIAWRLLGNCSEGDLTGLHI